MQPAGVAQLVEQLICNQQVGGSSPFASSLLMCASLFEAIRGKTAREIVCDELEKIVRADAGVGEPGRTVNPLA